ncbi:MAG: DUF192 domain-containing protein [Micropepsaceae bacterium]
MLRFAAAFAAVLSLTTAACADPAPAPAPEGVTQISFRTTPLEIVTAAGPQRFTVEVAETPEQRERGLMYRETMAADAGMIFDYHRDVAISMWMKNTVLPLDMVFVRADGTVSGVATGAVPYSLDIIASGEPVRAVVELNAGTVERLGIKAGDTVRHEIFGNAP